MRPTMSGLTRRGLLRLLGVVASSQACPALSTGRASGESSSPLERARVVWHMGTLESEGGNVALQIIGKEGIAVGGRLNNAEFTESRRRGSDGLVASFGPFSEDDPFSDNESKRWLSLDAKRAEAIGFAGANFSLYVRTFLKEPDGAGTLLFSKCIALAIHRTSLAIAFLRQRTPEGITFRELPLCNIERGQWLDLVLRISDQRLEFFCNGRLKTSILLTQPADVSLNSELMIGAFAGIPGPDFPMERSLYLGNALIDTVALWSDSLGDQEVASLCGSLGLKPQSPAGPADQAIAAYNRFYDASQSKDLELCHRLEKSIRDFMTRDPTRPVYHLTAPIGWIFDPSGAFHYQKRYHVFSYHNIYAVLRFNSQDHYVGEDLVHWRMWPTAPVADSEKDIYAVWLINHFLDDRGLPNITYGGFDAAGEQGIRAISRDGLISYTDKRVVMPDYHDGHVWKEGDTWYAITMRRIEKKTPKNPEIVVYSSTDLDHWEERGVLFRAGDYISDKRISYMEFPYLFSLAGKDVLMAGCDEAGVLYWIGHFDKNSFKFVPDDEVGLRVDYANPFHCFNPLTVDDKGPNGEPRRIIMAMYPFLRGSVDGLPWNGVHAMPRQLSLDGKHLRQDPLPEFASLRGKHHSSRGITVTPDASGYIRTQGDALEIDVEFTNHDAILFGVKVRVSRDRQSFVRVFYDARSNEYGLDGNVSETLKASSQRKGPTYISAGFPVRLRIFVDKTLVEAFVNGQTCTIGLEDKNPANVGIDLFSEGGESTCDRLDIWEMTTSF